MAFDETALPILAKGKNTNTKLIFWEGLLGSWRFQQWMYRFTVECRALVRPYRKVV